VTRIEVAPDSGRWTVKVMFYDPDTEAGLGYDKPFRFKFSAVLYARRTAREQATPERPVSLRIKKKNGRYQEERTYPRSADPRRTKG